MIGTPIAPQDYQVEFLNETLSYLEGKGMFDKLVAEFETEKKEGIRESSEQKLQNFTLPAAFFTGPVYNLETWTGDEMQGKQWKKMRNIINSFRKKHEVEVVDSKKSGQGRS